MLGSIFLNSYIALTIQERNYIVALCVVNLLFCAYYLLEVLKLEYTFRLEKKSTFKFGKRIGVITLLYLPHLFLFATLFLWELHNLELIMVGLIIIVELTLIVLVLKEVYDLLFLEEVRKNFEINENRKKYLEKEKRGLQEEIF